MNRATRPMINLREYLQGVEGFVTALQAGIDGVYSYHRRRGKRVSMVTFGEYDPSTKTCFGCLAHVALVQIYQHDMKGPYMDFFKELEGMTACELEVMEFERAVDHARQHSIMALVDFCQIDMCEHEILKGLAAEYSWGIGTYMNDGDRNAWKELKYELERMQVYVDKVMERYNLEWEEV